MPGATLAQIEHIVDEIDELASPDELTELSRDSSTVVVAARRVESGATEQHRVIRVSSHRADDPPPPVITRREGSRIVAQQTRVVGDFRIVWRDYVESLLSDSEDVHWSNISTLQRWQFGDPVKFITEILLALDELHSLGIAHGDLRPEKIGKHADGYVLRDPGLSTSYKSLRYVAPERVRAARDEASTSSDIHSFFSLALDVLRPYRGDRSNPPLAKLDGQVRWLKDFFSTRTVRPSARSLLELVENTVSEQTSVSLSGRGVTRQLGGSDNRTRAPFKDLDTRYPETLLTMEGQSLFDLKQVLATLAPRRSRPTKRLRDPKARVPWLFRRETTRSRFVVDAFPEGIDRKWHDAIHRSFFGFPIDDEHGVRMLVGHHESADEELAARYGQAVVSAGAARSELLRENQFLSTEGVLYAINAAGTSLSRDDLLVLRRWGRVLALPDHDRFLYPVFQFNEGRVSPYVGLVHDALRAVRSGLDASPWIELTFFGVRRDRLSGRAIKDVLWKEQCGAEIRGLIERARM